MNKFLVFLLLLLTALSYYFLSPWKKREIVDNSEEEAIEIDSELNAKKTVSNDLAKVEETISDEGIPWQELQDNWHEELKNLMLGLEPNTGEELFDKFLLLKKEFEQDIGPLLTEKSKYVKQSLKNQKISLSEKQKFIEIDKKADEVVKNYRLKIKELFGPSLPAIKKQYQEYLEGIQVHNNNEGRIGLDQAFESE